MCIKTAAMCGSRPGYGLVSVSDVSDVKWEKEAATSARHNVSVTTRDHGRRPHESDYD